MYDFIAVVGPNKEVCVTICTAMIDTSTSFVKAEKRSEKEGKCASVIDDYDTMISVSSYLITLNLKSS